MRNNSDFQTTFNTLKGVLKKYEKKLRINTDKKDNYSIVASYNEKHKADIYFGGVIINKNYVSYHLMPVYVNPELLKDISPELKKRMQGKSCFNFKTIDKELLGEIKTLTKKGFEFYKKENMI